MGRKIGWRDHRLDVIRGLAVTAVVAIHTAQVAELGLVQSDYVFSELDLGLRAISEYGKYGVELFFFLSGILLASLYGQSPGFSLFDYSKKRLARIIPLWLVFSLGSFLLYSLFSLGWWKGLVSETEGGVTGNLLVLVSTLFFITWLIIPGTAQRAVQGGWSIESEMAHYAIYPLIRLFSAKSFIVSISACGVLAFLNDAIDWSIPLLEYFSESIESLSILTTLPFFIAGLLVVKLRDQPIIWRGWFSNLIFVMFSILGFVLFMANQVPFGQVWEAVIFVGLIIFLALGLSRIPLLVGFFVSIGKYSYFTYFFHFYVVSAFVYFQTEISDSAIWREIASTTAAFPFVHALLFSVSLAVCQFFGYFCYKYLERPILRRARSSKTD